MTSYAEVLYPEREASTGKAGTLASLLRAQVRQERACGARLEGRDGACTEPISSVDLVCGTCGAPVSDTPFHSLLSRLGLWAARGAMVPAAVGLALGLDFALYMYSAVLAGVFFLQLFRRHMGTRIFTLSLQAAASIGVACVAFVSERPDDRWVVVGIVALLVTCAGSYCFGNSRSWLDAILEANVALLVTALPAGAAIATFVFGGQYMDTVAIGGAALCLSLAVFMGSDVYGHAFARSLTGRLKAFYVGAPRRLDTPRRLSPIPLADAFFLDRPLIMLANPAIMTYSAFRHAAVSFLNASIQAAFAVLNGSIRFGHRIILRLLDVGRASIRLLAEITVATLRSLADYAGYVVVPAALLAVAAVGLSEVSSHATTYASADWGFSAQAWGEVALMMSAGVGACLLILVAVAILVRPSEALWRSAGNFLPEQFFYGVLFFWATAMLALLWAPVASSLTGREVDSVYSFGPFSALASGFLAAVVGYGVIRVQGRGRGTTDKGETAALA